MSTLAEGLARQARALPAEDRARLAEDLLASLDAEPDTDVEVETAWAEEIGRRVQSIRDGTATLIPAQEVYAEIERRRLGN